MDSEQLLPYIIAAIIGILFGAWVTRMIFSISRRIRYQEAQMKLLAKIAEKSGVSKDEIEVILRVADRP